MDKADVKTVVSTFMKKINILNGEDKEKAVAQFKEEVLPWLAKIMADESREPQVDFSRLVDNDEAKSLLKNLDHLAGEHMEEAEELIVSALEGGDYTGAIQAAGFHQGCRSMREEIRGIIDSEFSED